MQNLRFVSSVFFYLNFLSIIPSCGSLGTTTPSAIGPNVVVWRGALIWKKFANSIFVSLEGESNNAHPTHLNCQEVFEADRFQTARQRELGVPDVTADLFGDLLGD